MSGNWKAVHSAWGGWAQSRSLPRIGWTWTDSVREGRRRGNGAVPGDIPASYGLERRGVWYLLETGIRGLLVPDELGWAVCDMLCEPSSHYSRMTTGSDRMPVWIDSGFRRGGRDTTDAPPSNHSNIVSTRRSIR